MATSTPNATPSHSSAPPPIVPPDLQEHYVEWPDLVSPEHQRTPSQVYTPSSLNSAFPRQFSAGVGGPQYSYPSPPTNPYPSPFALPSALPNPFATPSRPTEAAADITLSAERVATPPAAPAAQNPFGSQEPAAAAAAAPSNSQFHPGFEYGPWGAHPFAFPPPHPGFPFFHGPFGPPPHAHPFGFGPHPSFGHPFAAPLSRSSTPAAQTAQAQAQAQVQPDAQGVAAAQAPPGAEQPQAWGLAPHGLPPFSHPFGLPFGHPAAPPAPWGAEHQHFRAFGVPPPPPPPFPPAQPSSVPPTPPRSRSSSHQSADNSGRATPVPGAPDPAAAAAAALSQQRPPFGAAGVFPPFGSPFGFPGPHGHFGFPAHAGFPFPGHHPGGSLVHPSFGHPGVFPAFGGQRSSTPGAAQANVPVAPAPAQVATGMPVLGVPFAMDRYYSPGAASLFAPTELAGVPRASEHVPSSAANVTEPMVR